MKIKIYGESLELLGRVVQTLINFNSELKISISNERMIFDASNSSQSRTIQHLFKKPFFSVDGSGEEGIISVNISDFIEVFETIETIVNSFSSAVGILEIEDVELIIIIKWQEDSIESTMKVKLFQTHTDSQDLDITPEIEEIIEEAEENEMPGYIIKTMKEFKRKKDELIVIN
jgi:hypothetical protein